MTADNLGVKNFEKIGLYCNVSEINLFLYFVQKFKMATKNAEKAFFGKIASSLCEYLGAQNFAEIALSRTTSKINVFLSFMQKIKMATKNGRKTIFWTNR